ncbi:MAG: hypothetical protein K0S65_5726, partial [Labilithrix sp.]|nr:hypothetical protein [Labilithrix sp.]
MLASCKGCDDTSKGSGVDAAIEASAQQPMPTAEQPVSDSAAPPSDASAPTDASVTIDEPYGDAGTSTCRLLYGPAEQPFRGPAALTVVGQELRQIANDAGKPRVYPVAIPPVPPKGASPIVPPRPSSFTGMRWPPCVLAGRFAYCQAPGGPVVRSVLGSSEPARTIAKSRSGTRIAAAALGPDHSVVAFLDMRRTTEGDMLQAFVALDEREPVRLSEDGAGATTLHFLPRRDKPVAVYLDTRTAMVPVHARPMTLEHDDLALGADAVIFVGGAPERGIDFAVASAGAKSFAFVPMPRETIEFGMAALQIEDPPKDDVTAVWSRYPNGLDPAPIAAAPTRDGKGAWVARVRPREKAPGSPRILELGRVDGSGTFTSYGEIAPGPSNRLNVTDISLVEDASGAVWILHGDTTVTWLERRMC